MPNLNRYAVRQQQRRLISVDALNAQHAKSVAVDDALTIEDVELVTAQLAVLTAVNVGVSAQGQTLNRYSVALRYRRTIVIDALDNADARAQGKQDQETWEDTIPLTVQPQQVLFLKENTGVA